MTSKMKVMEDNYNDLSTRNLYLEKEIRTQQAAHEQTLNDTKQRLSTKVQALERENRSLWTEKEGSKDEAAQLRQSLDQLRSHAAQLEESKAEAENSGRELQRQLQTSHTKLADLEQKLKLSAAESERLQRECQDLQTKRVDLEKLLQESTAKSEQLQRECQDVQTKRVDLEKLLKEMTAKSERFQTQSEDLEKKKAALELELDTQASQFARMMASKEKERSEVTRRAQAAEKSLAATKRRLDVLKAEQQEKLEQLQTNISTIKERLGQQTDRQADVLEGVTFLVQRQKEKDLDLGSMLTSLEPELRQLCFRIERHVGCQGIEFSERLLRGHHDPRDDEIWKHHGFLTRSSFWRLVRRWTTVSLLPDSQAPLTLHHLQQVCACLQPDPRSVQRITGAHEDVLEKNFAYLSKELDFDEVLDHVTSFAGLNEHARQFLRDESLKTRFQKTARLLDVVYSLGEAGYRLLRDVMVSSGHDHVLPIFPPDADVTSRKDTDRRRTEAVADAGPDNDGNVNPVVVLDDDNVDDEGPGERGDEGALALHDEDRRPDSVRELRGLMGNMAALLEDTRQGQRDRDQAVTAVEQRLDGALREIGTVQERMAALNGGMMQVMEERQNAAAREMMQTMEERQNANAREMMQSMEERQNANVREMTQSMEERQNANVREMMQSMEERQNANAREMMHAMEERQNANVREMMQSMEERQNAAAREMMHAMEERQNAAAREMMHAMEERQNAAVREMHETAGLSNERVMSEVGARMDGVMEDVRSAQERMSDSVAAMAAKLRESHDMVTERMNAAEHSSGLLRDSVLEQMERLEVRQKAAAERLEEVCRQLVDRVESVNVTARGREGRQPGSVRGEVSSQSAELSDEEVLIKEDGDAGKKSKCCCF